MRIDKFLKVSRIIKRRTLANEACESGKVKINGQRAKPSTKVKIGDVVDLNLGSRDIKFEVTTIAENVSKADASLLTKIIKE